MAKEEEESPVIYEPIDIETAAQFISQGGALSKISKDFEERESQIELLKKIGESLNEQKIGVFEAGTGVGKSYAYLIPSILYSILNNQKVIISTGTINLQQQLCEKDIPAVQNIIQKKFKYILLKGRQNYVCLRRFNDVTSTLDLFEDETKELELLVDWVNSTKTGSKSEMDISISDTLWSRINSESDACMGKKCPFQNDCFIMKVRKAANNADIIVVNHHLLFADIESRMNGAGYKDTAVLPPYHNIIFDEAHGIEAAATSFFSETTNRFKINKLLNQIYRKNKKSENGILCSLEVFSKNGEEITRAYGIVNDIKNSMINVEIASKDLMEYESTKRLYEATARDFGPFLVAVGKLANDLGRLTDLMRLMMDGIAEEDKDVPPYWEAKLFLRNLDRYVILFNNFSIWDEKKENVYWIQKKRLPPDMIKDGMESEYINFNQTPLDISYLMNAGIYEEMSSVVFTSATLRTGRDYNYWMNRTGINFIEKNRVLAQDYKSPFPYNKNMLFAVPNDAPLPEKMEYQQYIEMAIPRLITAAEGRTLVLFTSYESLKNAHKNVCLSLRGFAGSILRQGQMDNAKVLEAFKTEISSVLFATDSFWQGVDIPGEALSQVIIVKLPFTVPNDPVLMAKSDAIKERGGNSFMELNVPEAVIKFRQGTGRLIRRSDDKGAVVCLDRRIYEKMYGSIFLASLPECKRVYEPTNDLVKTVNRFIFD